MIYDASTLGDALTLTADLCVVGSGPGGTSVATLAAEAGLRVVMLEAGELVVPGAMVQREERMFPRLYWDAAGRTNRDHSVRIHQGKGVGGSSLHNLNLCKRVPDELLARWDAERHLEHLPLARWHALYEEVETLLSVSDVPTGAWNRGNRLLESGCQALGWRGGGLKHNRTGCIGSGFCEVGCHYDAKNNALKVLVPRLVAAGGEILTRCQAVRVTHDRRKVTGVVAAVLDEGGYRARGSVTVRAPRVCVAGSATSTPALLIRSRVPSPVDSTGATLRVHPALLAAGDFDEPVYAWRGIPQTYECTEHLSFGDRPEAPRIWIVPAFAHPVGAATMLPGFGRPHAELLSRYPHLMALTPMLHDHTRGTVEPQGDLGLTIDYWPNPEDRRQLGLGLWACVHLLFAAGARRVLVPNRELRVIERGQSYEDLRQRDFSRGDYDVTAVHPMASVPMGDDRNVAAVDSRGKHHHLDGLWVADGSLFPTSIGVPPQLSVFALGLHVGRALIEAA